MSQIKIVKYLYNKSGTFEVVDEYGARCWIEFQQAEQGQGDYLDLQNEFLPIEIETDY